MTSTPEPHVPANAELDDLESKTLDELVSPEEAFLQKDVSDPQPTDAIGSEDWGTTR